MAIGHLFRETTVADVRNRFKIGTIVLRMRSQSINTCLDNIAKLLNCSSKVLYQHGLVAERFRASELDDWLATANVWGHPPTWSHFVAFAALGSRSAREAALADWKKRPTSVRGLTVAIKASRYGMSGKTG